MLPSVFADSLMIIGPDGADSQRSQGDRKIGKDERPPSLFYVIQTGWIFFRTEGHAGEKEKGWHVECVNPPEYGVVHGHNVAQHTRNRAKPLAISMSLLRFILIGKSPYVYSCDAGRAQLSRSIS